MDGRSVDTDDACEPSPWSSLARCATCEASRRFFAPREVGGLITFNPDYTTNRLFPLNLTVDQTEVAPGGQLVYTVTGTNRYNVAVNNVVLRVHKAM